MDPFENEQISDSELDGLLSEWKIPPPSARLRSMVFAHGERPWWKWIWTGSIRIPVPVAIVLAIAVAFGVWKATYVERPSELRPVAELRLRIIRNQHARN